MPICMSFHVMSPSLTQAGGFVTGSSRNLIDVAHWHWKKGIEFSYDADATVTGISISKPVGAAPVGLDSALSGE